MTQQKLKVKKGDDVVVIAGKDVGKRGTVRQIKRMGAGRARILVDGVNLIKKHVRPNPKTNEPGGLKSVENWLDISNVKLWNAAAKKGDRVTITTTQKGERKRIFKSTKEMVDASK